MATPLCNGRQFNSFLILPVQRPTRYDMMLKEVLKNTPDSHPEHGALTAVRERSVSSFYLLRFSLSLLVVDSS